MICLRTAGLLAAAALLSCCGTESIPRVVASYETEPVLDGGDAADDPAIWINAVNPSSSLVLGTNKQRGLDVYDLEGNRVQSLETGRLNNVDVRQRVEWNQTLRDIAVATNRTNKTLDLFFVDSQTGETKYSLDDSIQLDFDDPYGMCLYLDKENPSLYAFVNDKSGRFQQWQLLPEAASKITKEFSTEGQPEGCVADDEAGVLYFGEEEMGIWRLDLRAPAEPTLVDSVEGPNLVADVEGLTLYKNVDGTGFLVASSQGNSTFAVYRREEANEFIGVFRVADNKELELDGVSNTDGIAATSVPVGSFASGLLVVQDDRNTHPRANQNFKLISWAAVAEQLQL